MDDKSSLQTVFSGKITSMGQSVSVSSYYGRWLRRRPIERFLFSKSRVSHMPGKESPTRLPLLPQMFDFYESHTYTTSPPKFIKKYTLVLHMNQSLRDGVSVVLIPLGILGRVGGEVETAEETFQVSSCHFTWVCLWWQGQQPLSSRIYQRPRVSYQSYAWSIIVVLWRLDPLWTLPSLLVRTGLYRSVQYNTNPLLLFLPLYGRG